VGGEGGDARGRDLVAKEGNRGLGKTAFGQVDLQAVVAEEVEKLAEV